MGYIRMIGFGRGESYGGGGARIKIKSEAIKMFGVLFP
jgi:hypothetical protein